MSSDKSQRQTPYTVILPLFIAMGTLLLFCIPLFAQSQENDSVSLSLNEAKNIALKNNQTLKSANEMLKSAEYQKKAAFTRFLPSLNMVGTYMQKGDVYKIKTDLYKLPVYSVNSSTGAVTPIQGQFVPFQLDMEIDDKDSFIFSTNLTQPIFTGGKLITQYKLSKNLEKINQNKLSLTQQEIIVKTEEAYWRVISLQEKKLLAKQYLETIEKHLSDLENYKAAGIITQNDLLKVKVKLNEAQLNLLKASNGVTLSKMALNQILGIDLQTEVTLTEGLEEQINENKPEISIQEAMQSRPELKMMKSSVDIAGNYKSLQLSRYFPNIVLNAGYQMMNPNPYNSLKDETGKDWTIALVAQLELFHWNERGFSLNSAKRTEKSVQYQYEETKELLNLEMQQIKFLLEESKKKVLLSKTGLEQSEENLRLCNEKFYTGVLKSSDVLDAQTLWQNAKSEYIDSLSEYQLNLAKYNKAFGLIN